MQRFIDHDLRAWKNSSRRKPLIIRGARQVGKTFSVKRFAETCFENYALVDLEKNPDWHGIFEENLNVQRICSDLEVLLGKKITPGKSLLFIDEIQSCPQAIMALRYFHEDLPELHVIAAGSLLEFAMKHISFPVGRIQFLYLRPLSFAEFLAAKGNESATKIILSKPQKLSQPLHEHLCKELHQYFFIGGMPESVKAFIVSGSLQESFEVQKEICETYRLDFAKYQPGTDSLYLNSVLTSVSQHVGKQIKYARLGEGFSNPVLKKSFHLLRLANIIHKVPAADPSDLPLGATASEKIFKSLIVDIGLMGYLTGMSMKFEYQKQNLLDIYRGSMAEQFVGQEMILSQDGIIHYWSRQAKSSTAEVDFLAVKNDNIFPIEVKSGSSGKLKSLHLCLEKYKNCPSGIVFSSRPYAELTDQKLLFIPIYYAFSATGGKAKMENQ
ncbi:MAG: nuclease [Deltaproteobacteria bacterium]|nr:MAG: nuclease [Deltaproteobacteria bacterium]RLC13165.1 MAG: nuclease [Deltaproteobacteria bacterium]